MFLHMVALMSFKRPLPWELKNILFVNFNFFKILYVEKFHILYLKILRNRFIFFTKGILTSLERTQNQRQRRTDQTSAYFDHCGRSIQVQLNRIQVFNSIRNSIITSCKGSVARRVIVSLTPRTVVTMHSFIPK